MRQQSLGLQCLTENMVCVHTKSESDDAFQRHGRLNFFRMATKRHIGFQQSQNSAV